MSDRSGKSIGGRASNRRQRQAYKPPLCVGKDGRLEIEPAKGIVKPAEDATTAELRTAFVDLLERLQAAGFVEQ